MRSMRFTGSRMNASLLGLTTNLMMSSNVNQPLQTHSMKKNASWGSVFRLSSIHVCCDRRDVDDRRRPPAAAAAVDVNGPTLKLTGDGNCVTVRFWITGSRRFGCVLRQKIKIETRMKKTDTTATT